MFRSRTLPIELLWLLRYLSISVALFMAVRGVFLGWNWQAFLPLSPQQALHIWVAAAIQDVATVLWVQLPFVGCYVGLLWWRRVWLARLAMFFYHTAHLIGLVLCGASAAYYSFCSRQINFADLQQSTEMRGALGTWGNSFLPIIVILWGFFLAAVWLCGQPLRPGAPTTKAGAWQTLAGLAALFFLGWGGLATRVVRPSSTLYYTSGKHATLAINPVLNVLYTAYLQQTYGELRAYHFLDTTALDAAFTIDRNYTRNLPFGKKNVVIFILETFPRSVLQAGDPHKAVTPFFDSLRRESMVFDNAFSSGLQSNEGFQGIMGSMPVFEGMIYFKSRYLSNKIQGIGSLLTAEGYDTNFFLGFHPNTFSFGEFTTALGIQHYYSEEDCPNYKARYQDWGVPDDQYLQYVAATLSRKPTPFFATVFTTSTHHPYRVPPPYTQRFSLPNQSPHQNAVSYVDFCFQQFFAQAQHTAWFRNTVFLFVADHSKDIQQQSAYERYRISSWLYDPSNPALASTNTTIVQQIDLLPSLLDYIHYPHSFAAFGTSIWDTSRPHYAYMQATEPPYLHQIVSRNYLLTYHAAADSIAGLYATATDPQLTHNLWTTANAAAKKDILPLTQTLKTQLQAFIQRYHTVMRQNTFVVKK